MNRAQNSFVDERLERVQSAHDELRCYFADHKTMQIRPATTYDLSDKSRIRLLDLRDAPNCEFDAIRQHVRNMKPYMLTAQYNDDNSNDDSISALCEQQANQGGYFLLNLSSCPKEQDPSWDISLGFRTNLPGLIRSFAETGEDLHLHFDSAKRVAEAAVESAIARFQRTGSARLWDGTFFTTWSTPIIGNLSKVDRKKAERINQQLQKNVCQTFQTEAAIDLCDQDQVLREHFPATARSHRDEILPPRSLFSHIAKANRTTDLHTLRQSIPKATANLTGTFAEKKLANGTVEDSIPLEVYRGASRFLAQAL